MIDEFAKMGAFGIKISPEYGGLGLSQTNYCRAAMVLGGCAAISRRCFLRTIHRRSAAAHPFWHGGAEAKIPAASRRGEISAFALTESGVGSDPAQHANTRRADA